VKELNIEQERREFVAAAEIEFRNDESFTKRDFAVGLRTWLAAKRSMGGAEVAGNDELEATAKYLSEVQSGLERACRAEDALCSLVRQIQRTSPVDDHGHDFKMNTAYLSAVHLIDEALEKTK